MLTFDRLFILRCFLGKLLWQGLILLGKLTVFFSQSLILFHNVLLQIFCLLFSLLFFCELLFKLVNLVFELSQVLAIHWRCQFWVHVLPDVFLIGSFDFMQKFAKVFVPPDNLIKCLVESFELLFLVVACHYESICQLLLKLCFFLFLIYFLGLLGLWCLRKGQNLGRLLVWVWSDWVINNIKILFEQCHFMIIER